MSIPVLQRMRDGIYRLTGFGLPGTYTRPTKSDPKFKCSAYSVPHMGGVVDGSRLTQSQGRNLAPVVQGNERDGHGGSKERTRREFPRALITTPNCDRIGEQG